MNADYLDAAEQLAASLLAIRHVEKRGIAVARILNVLAAAVDGTDAYEPLTTTASEIEAQSRKNIQAQCDSYQNELLENAAFCASRYNQKVRS